MNQLKPLSENKPLEIEELRELLDFKYNQFNCADFIKDDPISIPHLFSNKQDIEISAFLSATIAWGQRKTIVSNARKIATFMDDAPYDFVTGYNEKELLRFKGFVHRTFNDIDVIYFIKALRNIYSKHNSMESLFNQGNCMKDGINAFRDEFFSIEHEKRSEKHISNPRKNAACKRLNMFLRWMVRQDKRGVDFGIWKEITPAKLICPLDVHTARTGRLLGLITKKQDNWDTAEELTAGLRLIDPLDPVKYDFALFGLGLEMNSEKTEVRSKTTVKSI